MVFAKWIGCTLPSETEWEYACRGGEGGSDFMTDDLDELKLQLDQKVNYTGDKTNKTRAVIPINPQFANTLGLVDMIGNLREWCIDWFDEEFYLKRLKQANDYRLKLGYSNCYRDVLLNPTISLHLLLTNTATF